MKKKIIYVSELNLPNNSAYSIHVMKMCEAFSKLKYNVNLFTINAKNTKNIFNFYNIKYQFKISSIFKKKIVLNFFQRLFFSIQIICSLKDDDNILLSRSIIFAMIAAILKKNIILELHHEITGFSKVIFQILKKLKLISNLKYVFIHKNLANNYKIDPRKYIILDDAVCLEDFNFKKSKPLKKTCVYVGSFYDGKGPEFIFKLAKLNSSIDFHLFGNKLNYSNKLTNIKLKGFKKYKDIPKLLSKYDVALMPYLKKVKGKSSIQLEKYMSPLKMFDYMASKKIILASNLNIYKHILKDNFNSKLIETNDINKWGQTLNKIFKNLPKYKYLSKNAYNTVKQYTWEKRVNKIIKKY